MKKTNEGLKIYRDHCRLVISNSPCSTPPRFDGLPQRGSISRFSKKSQARMVQYLSSCVAQYRNMGTLTVRQTIENGIEFKRYCNQYFNWFQEAQKSNAVSKCTNGRLPPPQSIFWFLEFQERGAPHIHFFYTGFVHWKPAAQKWAECVGDLDSWKTSTKFEELASGRGGTISYARKYARKESQKQVPTSYSNVGRFWGVRGYKETLAAAHVIRSRSQIQYCRDELWPVLLSAELNDRVRIFRWTKRDGVTIVCKGDETLQSLGIMELVDTVMVNDIIDRAYQKTDHDQLEHAKEVENGLRRQRRQA